MEWFGHAKISFTSHPNSLDLKDRGGAVTSLRQVCEEATPPCILNPLLFNGHLQTFFTALKAEGPPIYYKRKIFEAEDPAYEGSFAVDFVAQAGAETDTDLPIRTSFYRDSELEDTGSLDNRPMLIALHGLSGGSYEIYLRHVLAPLIHEGGWEACVINSRGCAGHRITSSVLYNARATWDTRQTVKWLQEAFPNRPLFGIGFSLGANILTNYLGEEGDGCPLKAAVVVSNPWNLDAGNHALQRTWLGREVYSKTMGGNLKSLVALHKDQLKKNPKIDFASLEKITYLHEFDRAIQCPTWGYPTESAYYRDASSSDSLLAVRIPFFAVNAKDDPIAVNEALPYEEFKQNPHAVLCTTSLGGHLSWFEPFTGHRWHARPCVNFLNKMAFDYDFEAREVPRINGSGKARTGIPTFDAMRRKMYTPEDL
ncbi:MAG: hypothetical protein M1818_000183 [Claussenomyces sp. TS43310]|nr:MAG: hypothetical protein M1818_000183 [Claussenomyces sp. TS43310]